MLKCKHIEAIIKENRILIFTSRRNNRNYKNKKWWIGDIFYHNKSKHWCFIPAEHWSFGSETMDLITILLYKIENNIIRCDFEKGDFKNEI